MSYLLGLSLGGWRAGGVCILKIVNSRQVRVRVKVRGEMCAVVVMV